MNVQTQRLFKDLLFLHGHVADPRLGATLADDTEQAATDQAATTPGIPEESHMNLFKSFWLLGGLASIDPRVEDEETGFNPSYGNRIASERTFGKPRIEPKREAAVRKPVVSNDQRVAHC
ncbi:hypothetical protein LYSHEL_12610 [Lysobacter helvus]|uniref:Uncharacterized protein n=2 Tax=Lysobacteraceae TaxID=32033 RepID=A0ABM7Q4K4_9GAMM|nr:MULTISPECIES: hypothetical protein [Lysobacter]BCT92237.1 hypothetical protein LYSCAS_12610 [Lysobacter caseinilyticus]BCT95390.1 hypothetical protein LYSHEL_12610 [Lysobacter helvus]